MEELDKGRVWAVQVAATRVSCKGYISYLEHVKWLAGMYPAVALPTLNERPCPFSPEDLDIIPLSHAVALALAAEHEMMLARKQLDSAYTMMMAQKAEMLESEAQIGLEAIGEELQVYKDEVRDVSLRVEMTLNRLCDRVRHCAWKIDNPNRPMQSNVRLETKFQHPATGATVEWYAMFCVAYFGLPGLEREVEWTVWDGILVGGLTPAQARIIAELAIQAREYLENLAQRMPEVEGHESANELQDVERVLLDALISWRRMLYDDDDDD